MKKQAIVLILISLIALPLYAASTKISGMSDGSASITSITEVPVVRGGANEKVTVQSLHNAAVLTADVTTTGIDSSMIPLTTGTTPKKWTLAHVYKWIKAKFDSVYQALDTNLTTWAGVTPGTGVATALGNTTDASGGVSTYNAKIAAIKALSNSAGYLYNDGSGVFSYGTPSGSSHDAVTLGADADVLLGLSTQQITLDSQTANYVFAAPNGSAGDPTFRALVDADIPDTITASNYQPLDSDLTTLAGLTLTGNSKYLGTNSSGVAGVYDLPSGGSMVYPGAGVPNSTGSAWGTSYTVGTSANNLVQLNGSAALPAVSGANLTSVNAATLGGATFAAPGAIGGTTAAAGTFTTLSAGASGFGVDADGDVTAKSLTVAKVSGTAGTLRAYEANSTDTSTVGWMGPASISASWDYQFSSTEPAAGSIMLFGAPSSNISAQTWATLDDTGTNGDASKIWSADKCYDQDALRLALAGGTLTGTLITAASTTTAAGLRLPHGSAPTSPTNGDLWTTTAGLYARINGSTVGPFGTGGSMSWPGSAGIAVYGGSSAWGTSLTAPSGTIVGTSDTQTLTNKTLSTGTVIPVTIGIACSDESTALTTGTAKATFRVPHAMTLTAVRASVGTAPVGSTIIVDINEGGSTIMTTNKLSIDASEKTSTTAATAAGITDTSLADDAEITIDIDQIGSSTAGAGLKIWLIGTRTL